MNAGSNKTINFNTRLFIPSNDAILETEDGQEEVVELYKETYSIWLKITFLSIGCMSLIISVLAIIVMQRTRRIPHIAKFLSTSLLTFDLFYIISASIRKFIMDPAINLNLLVLGQSVLIMAYVTIALMAVERLIVFSRPNFYIKHCTINNVRIVAVSVWTIHVLAFLTLRYIVCYLKYDSTIMFVQAGLCNAMVYPFYGTAICGVLITSLACYCRIFQIVKNKSKLDRTKLSFKSAAKVIRSYKATSIVVIYISIVIISSTMYMIILLLRITKKIDVTTLRLSIEFSFVFNCVMDPFIYVLWFRESQMECLKLLCAKNSMIMRKVEVMRIEIFSIVVSDNVSTLNENGLNGNQSENCTNGKSAEHVQNGIQKDYVENGKHKSYKHYGKQIENVQNGKQNEYMKNEKQSEDMKSGKQIENVQNGKQIENKQNEVQIEHIKNGKQTENVQYEKHIGNVEKEVIQEGDLKGNQYTGISGKTCVRQLINELDDCF